MLPNVMMTQPTPAAISTVLQCSGCSRTLGPVRSMWLDLRVVLDEIAGHDDQVAEIDGVRFLQLLFINSVNRGDLQRAVGIFMLLVGRRHGIAERVLRRWKQELASAPAFVSVQITDAPAGERAP